MSEDEDPFEGRPISGRTELRVEDYRQAWAALPQTKSMFRTLAAAVVAIPAFSLVQTLSTGGAALHAKVLMTVVPSAFGAAAFVYFLLRGRATWARNAIADNRGAEGMDFHFDSTHFSLHSPGRDFHLAWETLFLYLELPRVFAIYTDAQAVALVPKRAFSETDQQRLRALLPRLVPRRPLRGVTSFGRTALLWVALVVVFLVMTQLLNK